MTRRLRGWREAALLVLFAVGVTVWFTWPLAARLDKLGRVDQGDGQFSIWNVAWVAHALSTNPRRLFDANIFYPHRNTLAYSEANLGAGVLGLPAYWGTRDAFVAHNTAFLLSFVLSITATYYLARYLTGSRAAALPAAVLFGFCPYLFARTAHIQLLMTFGLPLSLLAMHRFVDRPSLGRMVALGLALAVQAVFCAYYGVLAGLLVALGLLVYAGFDGRWRETRYWLLAVGAAGVAAMLLLPVFLPYYELQVTYGFSRPLSMAAQYAADWRAYFASSSRWHTWMLPRLGHWKEVLFPGFLATGFGLVGLALGLAKRIDTRARRHTVYYALVAIFAVWASFGPNAGLYTVLYHTVPIFSFLRAPARFGVAVSLALAVLAAFAITRFFTGNQRRCPPWLGAAALVGLGLADLHLAGMPLREAEPPSPVYRLLRHLPPGTVVELPFFYTRMTYYRHSWYMLQSTYHWKPLVNGYSDHLPQDFIDMTIPVSSFPNMEGFRLLEPRGVRYAVFHLNWYNTKNRTELLERLERYKAYLRPLLRDGDTLLYEIVAWPHREADP